MWSETHGDAVAERFAVLDVTDQEKLWGNVQLEAARENWMAGGPGDERFAGDRRPPLRPITMVPPLPYSGSLSLEEALNKLGKVRAKGREWRAYCPAHETHHYSLVISESKYKPGEPVFFCYAGCTHQQVKDKLLEKAA